MDIKSSSQIGRYVFEATISTHAMLIDNKGPRLLGYDLDLLNDYVQRKGTKKLVIALRDSEAFDPALLTDLLSLFQ